MCFECTIISMCSMLDRLLCVKAMQSVLQKLQPTPADDAIRQRVLQDVNNLVEMGLAGYYGLHVAPYGSFVSGLYTRNGDLDISIEGVRTT